MPDMHGVRLIFGRSTAQPPNIEQYQNRFPYIQVISLASHTTKSLPITHSAFTKMSTRRGVGLSAFQNRTSVSSSYATHGASLRSTHSQSIQTQLSVFQSQLHAFALQHADAIKLNPAFRAEFARMCNALGVDPLAASVGSVVKGKEKGNERGWWALLKNRSAGGGSGSAGGSSGSSGGEGQHEDHLHLRLAMRVVEICRAGRSINGGLLGVGDCRDMVKKGQGIGGEVEVTE